MNWPKFALTMVSSAVERIPLEKILFKHRDRSKYLKELNEILGGAQSKPAPAPAESSIIPRPTHQETTEELKRRLAKELYKAELDLSGRLRIAGKPCDCLDQKHTLGLEATAEELIAQEPDNPVYSDIIKWVKDNQHKVTLEAISSGQYDEEYPRMALEFKGFRKQVMGTAAFSAFEKSVQPITLEEAKNMAAEEAAKEVERKWQSQEKKQ